VPWFISQLSQENFKALLSGWIEGDGNIDKTGRVRVSTSDPGLAGRMFAILLAKNYNISLHYKRPKKGKASFIFTFRKTEKPQRISVRRIYKNQDDLVYDLQLATVDSYLTTFLTLHNSKIKNLKEIDVMVWEPVQKKTKEGKPLPVWMYISVFQIPKAEDKNWYPPDVVEWKGKFFAKIGRTYGTKVKAKRGDIITVMPIRIREYRKDGKRRVTWMFPNFKEKRPEKKEPDTWTTVQRLIRLGTGPAPVRKSLSLMSATEFEEFLDLSVKPITVEFEVCPYHHVFGLCPMLPRFGPHPRLKEKLVKRIRIEQLQFPIKCILAFYYRCYYAKDYYYDFEDVTLEQKIREYEAKLK